MALHAHQGGEKSAEIVGENWVIQADFTFVDDAEQIPTPAPVTVTYPVGADAATINAAYVSAVKAYAQTVFGVTMSADTVMYKRVERG